MYRSAAFRVTSLGFAGVCESTGLHSKRAYGMYSMNAFLIDMTSGLLTLFDGACAVQLCLSSQCFIEPKVGKKMVGLKPPFK